MLHKQKLKEKTLDYEVEFIEDVSSLQDFIPQWKSEEESFGKIHFYQDVERIFLDQTINRDEIGFRIIILRQNGRIQCIAPLIQEINPFTLKLGLFKLMSIQCRRFKLPGGYLLFAKHADKIDCIKRLLSLSKSELGSINCLLIEEMLSDDAKMLSTDLRGYKLRVMNHQPQGIWQLEIYNEYDDYFSGLKKKTRNEIRRKIRKVDAATRSWSIKRIDKPEQVVELLAAKQYVYPRSWKSVNLNKLLPNKLQVRNQNYLEAVAEKGWLRGYILYFNGIPRAYSINFQYKDTFHGEEMAYDKHEIKLSPGSVMVYEIIKDLHQTHPPKIMDFGFGDSALKKQFCVNSGLASDTYLVRSFTFASLLIELQFVLSKMYYKFHQMCMSMNLDDRFRKMLKC